MTATTRCLLTSAVPAECARHGPIHHTAAASPAQGGYRAPVRTRWGTAGRPAIGSSPPESAWARPYSAPPTGSSRPTAARFPYPLHRSRAAGKPPPRRRTHTTGLLSSRRPCSPNAEKPVSGSCWHPQSPDTDTDCRHRNRSPSCGSHPTGSIPIQCQSRPRLPRGDNSCCPSASG